MEDQSSHLLRQYCCSCLSRDRRMTKLCRINGGVNHLYSLLSYDSEAYREGFFMDLTNLFICWECKGMMKRFSQFRMQVCIAQKTLSSIVAREEINKGSSLSKLNCYTKSSYDYTFIISEDADNFVNCGPDIDLKSEPYDPDDVPLSQLTDCHISDYNFELEKINKTISNIQTKKKRSKARKVKSPCAVNTEQYYTTKMSEADMIESRVKRKCMSSYADAKYKCDSCLVGFRCEMDVQSHNLDLHTKKPEHTACNICLAYVTSNDILQHRSEHYLIYNCSLCGYLCYSRSGIMNHFTEHTMKKRLNRVKRKNGENLSVRMTGSKSRRTHTITDKRTPFGFACNQCDKYFDNKNLRWKHAQKQHAEGFACEHCGKRFAFKDNLNRHIAIHLKPPPREECPVCRKQVRVDLMRTHARTHTARQQRHCDQCGKSFVSDASYRHHLKYSHTHATADLLRHKCSECDKGYRSPGELWDHVNYQHRGITAHQCPECGKALATRRCILRHVRRAHRGIKENARDKICQQCGKAFRDKKGLREHELIHTGERPLSCNTCGATFRQSASLYTHRRRVHKILSESRALTVITAARRDGRAVQNVTKELDN